MREVPISKFSTQFYRHEDEIPLVVTKRGNPAYYMMKFDEQIVEVLEEMWGDGEEEE